MEPPQLVSLESEDQELLQLEQEHQTRLQQGRRLSLPYGTNDSLLWQPQGEPSLETAVRQLPKRPVSQEDRSLESLPECRRHRVYQHQFIPHGFDKCRDRSDYEALLEMNVSPMGSIQYHRQPQQQDENCGGGNDSNNDCMSQRQLQLQEPQQNTRQHRNFPLQNQLPHSTRRSHTFYPPQRERSQQTCVLGDQSNLLQMQQQQQQQQQLHQFLSVIKSQRIGSYPQLPPSFAQLNPATHPSLCQLLPNAYSNLQILTQTSQTSNDVADNTRAVSVSNQTQPNSNNMNYQKLDMLRPEIIQYNYLFAGRQSVSSHNHIDRALLPVGSNDGISNDLNSGGESRNDVTMARCNAARYSNIVFSEDDEERRLNCKGSPQESLNSFSLSSLNQTSSKLFPNNKVLRSKSLNCPPNQWNNSSKDSVEGHVTINAVHKMTGKKQKSFRNFVPVGPPTESDSLEVQHPSVSSVSSLGSGPMSCSASTSSPETKRIPPQPKRLSRSASSSPSSALEASACPVKPKNMQRGHESILVGLERDGTHTQCEPKNCAWAILNQPGSHLCRRCSVDVDVLKDRPDSNGIGYGRRFSVDGISSVNSGGNISSFGSANGSSSSSNCLISSIGSRSSSGVRSVSREHSCNESAYGSSEISLGSSASDSCDCVHGVTSISDSATDLSCDREMDALRSWHDLSSLVSPLVPEEARLESDCKLNTGSISPVPRRRPVIRFNSVPNYSTTESHDRCNAIDSRTKQHDNETKSNATKISNVLSQINDLSVSSSQQCQRSSAPGSLPFNTHQSLPPLMTCVNIPIN